MRISTNQFFINGQIGMQRVQEQLSRTQQKIALSTNYLTSSENPVATTKVMIFEEQLALAEKFEENIGFATNSTELAESTLGSIVNSLQRVRELIVGANTATLSGPDYLSIADELDGIADEIAGLMNAKDGVGDFLFSGFQSSTKPFIERNGGGWEFQGDRGVRFLEVSVDTKIEISFPGRSVFVDVEASRNTLITSESEFNDPDTNAFISIGEVIDQEAFDQVYPTDYVMTFNDPPTTYNIVERSDGSPVLGESPPQPLVNATYNEGTEIRFNGASFLVSGNPSAGDTYFIESTPREDILTSIYRISEVYKDVGENINLIQTAEGAARFQTASETALNNIDAGLISVSQERSRLGTNLNQLSTLMDMSEGLRIELRDFISDIEDLDIAEAATTLSQETFILEASQASFARISSLTIFNFLR